MVSSVSPSSSRFPSGFYCQKGRKTVGHGHPIKAVPRAGAMSVGTLSPPLENSAQPTRRGTYRCECGHPLRVFGAGRHRIYLPPGNTALDDPVMNRICPECGRGLPGKNA